MRTKEEVVFAFTPVGKLDTVTQQHVLRTEIACKELATELMDLVPECADRTVALRKLLEVKMTCIQAITHCRPGAVQAPSTTTHKETQGNVQEQNKEDGKKGSQKKATKAS